MHGADILICVVMLVSIVTGLWRGFMREAISLLFLVGGLIAAWQLAPYVEPYLGGDLALPSIRPWVARFLVFVVAQFVGALVGAIANYLTRHAGFGFVDRAFGFLFGTLRGAIVVGLLVIFGELVHLNHEAWWTRSRLIPYAQMVGDWLRSMVGEAGTHWTVIERARHATTPRG